MLGEFGSVIFRLEGTEEFLWKVKMRAVPREAELVGSLGEGGEVATWYRVEQIRHEIEYQKVSDPGGGEIVIPHADSAATVIVSVVV
jgi:hypothetical protein